MVSAALRRSLISPTQARILCALLDGWTLRGAISRTGRVRWTLTSPTGISSSQLVQPATARVLVDTSWVETDIVPGHRAIRHYRLTEKGRRLAKLAREEGYVS